jgi:hypothetical protein
MFAVGLVALWNLWKETIFQSKSKEIANEIRTGSFFRAIPAAILRLVVGFAIIFGGGALLMKPLAHFEVIYRELMFLLLAAMFGGLWRSTSHSAIVLRLILLSLFSAIIIAAALFFVAWSASQTAPTPRDSPRRHHHPQRPLLRPLGPPKSPNQQPGIGAFVPPIAVPGFTRLYLVGTTWVPRSSVSRVRTLTLPVT